MTEFSLYKQPEYENRARNFFVEVGGFGGTMLRKKVLRSFEVKNLLVDWTRAFTRIKNFLGEDLTPEQRQYLTSHGDHSDIATASYSWIKVQAASKHRDMLIEFAKQVEISSSMHQGIIIPNLFMTDSYPEKIMQLRNYFHFNVIYQFS